MSEFMDRFYASMEGYIWGAPDDPRAMIERFPGWEVDPQRLAIYGEFVPLYQRACLEALFGRTRRILGPAWRPVVGRYYATRPNHGYQINTLGHAFPEFLRQVDDLPPAAPEVALFELSVHQVYTTPVELPAAPAGLEVNPTLETLELEHAVCAWAIALGELPCASEPLEPPPAGEELVLLWRNPDTLHANYRVATPDALLALKIALEGIDPAAAAAAGGVDTADVQAAVDRQVERGLLLRGATP